MKRLDTINENTAKIYTLLHHFVEYKCSDALNHGHNEENEKVKEWITINEALSILKISRATLFRLRKNGQITYKIWNRSVRLLKSDVKDALIWYSLPKGKV